LEFSPLRHSHTANLELALHSVERLQNSDGSWPAFKGDNPEGCWTTSLAILTLITTRRHTERIQLGIRWLLDAKGPRGELVLAVEFQNVTIA
jgi:hypothetical protein